MLASVLVISILAAALIAYLKGTFQEQVGICVLAVSCKVGVA